MKNRDFYYFNSRSWICPTVGDTATGSEAGRRGDDSRTAAGVGYAGVVTLHICAKQAQTTKKPTVKKMLFMPF